VVRELRKSTWWPRSVRLSSLTSHILTGMARTQYTNFDYLLNPCSQRHRRSHSGTVRNLPKKCSPWLDTEQGSIIVLHPGQLARTLLSANETTRRRATGEVPFLPCTGYTPLPRLRAASYTILRDTAASQKNSLPTTCIHLTNYPGAEHLPVDSTPYSHLTQPVSNIRHHSSLSSPLKFTLLW
jgi:hypothetical protein